MEFQLQQIPALTLLESQTPQPEKVELIPEAWRISPSQMSIHNDCSMAWFYGYVRRIKKPGGKAFFDIGTYFHELSHVYYQMLQEGQKAGSEFAQQYMENRLKRALRELNFDNITLIALVSRMVREFVAFQSPRIDRGIKVLHVENFLEYEYTYDSGLKVIFNGYADLIYRDQNGRIRIRDHKTGTKKWRENALKLNNQLLFYATIYWLIYDEFALDVEISWSNSYQYKNIKNMPPPEERYQLLRHRLTEASVRNYWDYLRRQTERMLVTQPYEEYGQPCTFCQYAPICEQKLRGFEIEDLIRSSYVPIERNYGSEALNAALANINAADDEGD